MEEDKLKMKGKYLLVALVIAGIIIGYIGYTLYAPSEPVPTPTTPTPTTPTPTTTPTTPLPTAPLDRVTAWLWENGESELVGRANSDLCNYLLQTLRRVNLQARCVFSEEDIQEIKENDKVMELRFRFYENITISQWIEANDRDHIKTDEKGYRILEKVKYALFILEDNLDEGLEAHILVYSLKTPGSWSLCWAIQQEASEEPSADKTWIDEVNKLLSETVPTPTPTPTPVQMISFEEAVEFALKRGEPKWRYSQYDSLGKFEGKPFVTPDGLVEGYLEWRASNGTLYEAEYPSGEIYGEIERFTGVEDTEEYYVWMITLMDGMPTWIDARNGELLSLLPTRVPGVLTFKTAVRIVYAPQKRIEEWRVQEYKRIGDFEFGPYETPDGLVKGHLLWRASNGTLYEVTYLLHIRGKVLYIEAPDDIEEYYVWEITTEDKVYYIDARNGIIRLVLGTQPEDFPPHSVEYRDGKLYLGEEDSIEVILMEDIREYSHLQVRKGFILKRAVYQLAGADAIGYVIALDKAGRGFAIEPMNWTQGAFIFAPLESPESALEYVQFMLHETATSDYGRHYSEIRDQETYQSVIAEMREHAQMWGEDLVILAEPPINFTRVTVEDGSYVVERVYAIYLVQERLVYSKTVVYKDGRLMCLEEYVFLQGVAGPFL